MNTFSPGQKRQETNDKTWILLPWHLPAKLGDIFLILQASLWTTRSLLLVLVWSALYIHHFKHQICQIRFSVHLGQTWWWCRNTNWRWWQEHTYFNAESKIISLISGTWRKPGVVIRYLMTTFYITILHSNIDLRQDVRIITGIMRNKEIHLCYNNKKKMQFWADKIVRVLKSNTFDSGLIFHCNNGSLSVSRCWDKELDFGCNEKDLSKSAQSWWLFESTIRVRKSW